MFETASWSRQGPCFCEIAVTARFPLTADICAFAYSIGDHMPPNKFVWPEGTQSKAISATQSKALSASQTVFMKALKQVTKRKAPARTNAGTLKAAERVAQRLFPQCTKCSEKQSLAVKLGKQILVLHTRLGLPEVRE